MSHVVAPVVVHVAPPGFAVAVYALRVPKFRLDAVHSMVAFPAPACAVGDAGAAGVSPTTPEKVFETVAPVGSVMVMVNSYVPRAVGVPEICPDAESSERPAGIAPDETEMTEPGYRDMSRKSWKAVSFRMSESD